MSATQRTLSEWGKSNKEQGSQSASDLNSGDDEWTSDDADCGVNDFQNGRQLY
jgi:hypothetical protein